MKNKVDITTLKNFAYSIHENAIAKGFYDNQNEMWFEKNQRLEIVKELCEFHDAWKKDSTNTFTSFLYSNEKHKEELADVVIRVLDFMQWKQIDIEGDQWFSEVIAEDATKYFVSEFIWKTISYVYEDWYWPVIIKCYLMADFLNFDLNKEIQKKMQYNTTRPYLHGNKI